MPSYYCICRKSDSGGFMICCDNCEEWFHGKCINISKAHSKLIEHYYCDECRKNNPHLSIVYKENQAAKTKTVKQERNENRLVEKSESTSTKPKAKPKALVPIAKKVSPNKRKINQKTKSKDHNRKQCANPECVHESRPNSKYCSDDCGFIFNKLRYDTYFIPKWKALEENHSQARLKKMKDLDKLEDERNETLQLIRKLKLEKEELEENIRIIKEEAKKKLALKLKEAPKPNDDDDSEIDEDLTSDQTKTFCITCGGPIQSHNAFKHWATCHKKHEAVYNFTADVAVNHKSVCEEDPNPELYCHYQDKKTKRFCMHIVSACPQHSNWQTDKDEVCACPLKVMQKIVPEGNYCLELRKDCTQHYHWDKFRLAQMNMQRVNAFNKLEVISDRMRLASANLRDTYGGVIGVMLHNTIDHSSEKDNSAAKISAEDEDVDMTMD